MGEDAARSDSNNKGFDAGMGAQQAECEKLPRGPPPAGYEYSSGTWVHVYSGQRYDAVQHAQHVRLKKLQCMRLHYWERGGRERRLARYMKRRRLKPKHLTLLATTVEDPVDSTSSTPK